MGWSVERSRGSTALPGAADTEIIIERDESIVTLKCKKQKDGLEDARAAKAEADNAFKSAQRMVKKACTQECATAKQEFTTAEQVAKAAAREAETLAEEIAECKKSKDKGCGEKKKDFDAAKKAKMKADATLKRATKRKDAVCAK